jgi:hypothetical protein
MATEPLPKDNQLLAALPAAEWQRWQPLLERVDVPLGKVLYESGSTMTHVYFPTTAIVSLLYCECYAVVKKEYDRLLPVPAAGAV